MIAKPLAVFVLMIACASVVSVEGLFTSCSLMVDGKPVILPVTIDPAAELSWRCINDGMVSYTTGTPTLIATRTSEGVRLESGR